ncbi:unnamed protein product [Miscanthus lutarioriparius]|uniref:Alpha/beta hydrolase fold-3 domain-containing protein n=1 Tax=Miscanthus lutarioriparius TaxID=422564 RepID=A0A811QQH0_9POAL|nr:unnamed protein product [Miscanthus lutarioriparius]
MSSATTAAAGEDDEVVHDFAPLLLVYKSSRLERPLATPRVPPRRDAATGVVSKDVALSPHSFMRLYLPPAAATAERKLPVVVYFHGGGFVIGSAGSAAYHRCLNDLAAACPAVAVSVDYRLAPEHPVPASYEASLAALKWALSSSSSSAAAEADADPWLAAHGDPARVFLAGDSAGGNICHHLAMHPDVKGAGLKGVVLIHPWFWGKDPIGGEPRSPASKSNQQQQKGLWEFVCPGAVDGVDDPQMNPTAPGAPGLETSFGGAGSCTRRRRRRAAPERTWSCSSPKESGMCSTCWSPRRRRPGSCWTGSRRLSVRNDEDDALVVVYVVDIV